MKKKENDHAEIFTINCEKCNRLSKNLKKIKVQFPHYYCKPVPSFGSKRVKLLIVGLAPGLHGANQTGRPFTGDYAGIILYKTLYRFGYANQPISVHAKDGLRLSDCKITNAVKCFPPDNKPILDEVKQCNHYLRSEIDQYQPPAILALGRIAHQAVLRSMNLVPKNFIFSHAAQHQISERTRLFNSYHCSRYNTQTRRLSSEMFDGVFNDIHVYLGLAS